MLNEKLIIKIVCAVGLFFIAQVGVFWTQLQNLDEKKFMLVAEIDTLIRKRDELNKKIWMQEMGVYRMEEKLQRIDSLVRDRILLAEVRKDLPFIYFITPTYRRPTQKADLIRLAQTLAHVPNLYWIVVEDANNTSSFIADIFKKYRVRFAHLYALTPPEKKPNETDPNWKIARGVVQRNKALVWLRKNLGSLRRGVVYFGDDDNTYDWKLFEEMRSIERVGVWPVGLVGGLIAETAKLSKDKNVSFNSLWKPERPFPIDMAAFAINLSLALDPNAFFTYDVPRGYQESHFLTALGLKRNDLELKADGCTKVYVWHTRTERALLSERERLKFWQGSLNNVETAANMGERKGQNFYYPPDFDYKKHKSLNSYHGTHALRERAAKIKQGILIIRFEMPFNIWCLGCNNHIGMGVRYNAEKKKIGMYYTTPLYEFRMRCHLCSNYFVIRTDPEHFDYELVEGCRRQEKRYDPSTIDQLGAVDRSFNRQLESDRMFQVEHVEKDKEKAASSADKINKLEWIQERMRDDFAANLALRRSFKHEKASLKERRIRDEDLLKRMSLNIKLVSESAEDKKLAAAVLRHKKMKFTIIFLVSDEQDEEKRKAILSKPIFSNSQPSTSRKNDVRQKQLLSMKLRRNERNAFDNVSPTHNGQEQMTTENLGIIKRLKYENEEQDEIDILNKVANLDDVKPGNAELLYTDQMNLTNIKDEFVSDVKPDLCSKPLALVADYSGDSSSDSAD